MLAGTCLFSSYGQLVSSVYFDQLSSAVLTGKLVKIIIGLFSGVIYFPALFFLFLD